jgi:hypothetical protein
LRTARNAQFPLCFIQVVPPSTTKQTNKVYSLSYDYLIIDIRIILDMLYSVTFEYSMTFKYCVTHSLKEGLVSTKVLLNISTNRKACYIENSMIRSQKAI